jgi:hypothetical protein
MKQRRTAPAPKAADAAPKRAGRGWRSGLPPGIFIFLAVAAFYIWTATSSQLPFNWTEKKTDHYNLLADGFLNGHLYLAVDPPKELLALRDPYDPQANVKYRLHDASLYNGHYYIYFGPVPVLTLYVPWKLVTGLYMPTNFATILFCLAGYVFSCLLLFALLKAYRIQLSWFQKRLVIAALGLCQLTPILLRRAFVYEAAAAAGFCFAMAGLYYLARYVLTAQARTWHVVLAGLFLGLTPGCRPNYVAFIAVIGVFYLWYLARTRGLRGSALLRELYRFGAPIAVCAVLMLWYNYARFGNPLNIGQVYQLIGSVPDRGVTTKVSNLLPGLYKLLVQLPVWVRHFPFFELAVAGNFGAEPWPPGYDHIEALTGLLPTCPLCLLGLVVGYALWRWRASLSPALHFVLAAILCAAIVNCLAVVLTVNQVAERYEMDFGPELLVLSLFVGLALIMRVQQKRPRIAWEGALAVAVCATALLQALLSISGYDRQLMVENEPAFIDLAHFFGEQETTLRRVVAGLDMRGTITFQGRPAGLQEALLTTGVPRRNNCVLVEYLGGNHLRLGEYMSGRGTIWGPPVAVIPGKAYAMELSYRGADGILKIKMDELVPLHHRTYVFPIAYVDATVLRNDIGMPPGLQPFSGVLNADLGLQFRGTGANGSAELWRGRYFDAKESDRIASLLPTTQQVRTR